LLFVAVVVSAAQTSSIQPARQSRALVVTLGATTSPTAAQPSVQLVNVTGSNFPSEAIKASDVKLLIQPANGRGESANVTPLSIVTVTGSTRRITFQLPASLQVTAPTSYLVAVSGSTTGTDFASRNTASLTINPPASISSITPSEGLPGSTFQITIHALFTNFVQGSTQAKFGAGLSVGNGAPGDFGFVTVTSKTSATAMVKIALDAVADLRTVTIRTGVQEASQIGGFSVAVPVNHPPVANAGPAQTVNVGQTVQLSGAASTDLDGDPLTFLWEFVSLPPGSNATLKNADEVNPTFGVDRSGQYQVKMTVSDGQASSSDTVTISTVNSAPVANAGHDQTAFVKNTVTLDGTASSDVDGDPLTYQWTLTVPTGSTAQLSDPAAVMPTFVVDKDGIFTATLVVSDGQLHSAPSTVHVSVENSAPVANAGPDQTAHVGDTVTLDASASSDVDGNQLTYTWSLTTVPTGSAATLSDPHAVKATFSLDAAGMYVAQVIVSDGSLQSTDTVTITTVNSAPLANAGPDQTVPLGSVVKLSGFGSDADHDPLTFLWSLITEPQGSSAALDNSSLQDPSFTVDLPGTYIAQLMVNDGKLDSSPDKVIITTQNSRPVADAGPDQSVLTGTMVQLDGTASHDADLSPLTYLWSLLSLPPGSSASVSDPTAVKATFTADLAGTYVAQLIVNDGQLDSAPNTVTIAATADSNSADLELSLGVPNNAVAGSQQGVTFHVVVTNHGPATANNVAVTFKLPAGYNVVGGSEGPPIYDGSTGLWTIGSLGPSSQSDILVVATVNVTGPYDVTAAITSSSAPDPNLANNSVSGSVTPSRDADLNITFITAQSAPPVGSTETIWVRVRNNGPAPATGVKANFKLPAGYKIVGAPSVDGTYDPSTGDWTIGSMTPNGVKDLLFSVTVNPAGPYNLSTSTTGSDAPDPNLADNSATFAVTPNPNANLSISFFSPPTNPPVSSTVTFFIEVDNNGPAPTDNVKVNFKIPAGYTFTGGAPQVGTYDINTGDWVIGTLVSGGLARLILGATVNSNGPYDLSASITSTSAPDPNLADNAATASVKPNRNADLNISLFNPPSGTIQVGSNQVLFLEVNNNGPASTTNVSVSFKLPAGYTFSGGGPQVGTYEPGSGAWTIGPMLSGSLARLIIGATVNTSGPLNLLGSITNTDAPDPNLADNTVTATAPNRPPVASAGFAQGVATAATVMLDGSGSRDPDNDPLTYHWTMVARPANSVATLSDPTAPSPTFVADQEGTYPIRLVVTDSKGVASPVSDVMVTATAFDHPPVILSTPNLQGSVGQLYTYAVRALDPDAGDVLTYSLPVSTPGMTIDAATGLIQWTPTPDQAGTQSVTVRVQDSGGFFATQLYKIDVSSPSEHAPVAVDDLYEAHIDAALDVSAPGILRNDSDPDGDSLTPIRLTNPSSGALNFNPDGSFIYTPNRFDSGSLVFEHHLNLALSVPGTIVRASSFTQNPPQLATDEKLYTYWQSAFDEHPFIEIEFPQSVTVSQVQLRGTHDPTLAVLEFVAGTVQLFDTNGAILLDSGIVSLPAVTRDADVNVANLAGVKRVRFTPSADTGQALFSNILAEIKVIGSALVQRRNNVEKNLVQLLPTSVRASSSLGGNVPENAIDDLLDTGNWFGTTTGDFIEVQFPADTTVNDIETFAARGRPDGFGTSLPLICFGFFQAFDASGQALFDSGVVNWPDTTLRLPSFHVAVPDVSGVRRVRYTNTSCPNSSFPPGFAEFRVFGTAPGVTIGAFSMAPKFQALVGHEVHSTAVVAFLTDDNHDGKIDTNDIPDIIVPVESDNSQITGQIKAVSGKDGHELFTAGAPDKVSPWSEIAVGDINGDGLPEIIAVASDGEHLLAFDHTGQPLWTSDPNPMPFFNLGQVVYTGAISIANLDGQGLPEIVVGASVFDANGHLLGDGRDLGGSTGGGATKRAAISAIADLDLDGTPEIIAGPTAYKLVNGQLTKLWQRTDRPDGFVGIANFDDDPYPEIVVVAKNQIYMLNHDGTDAERWNPPTHAPITLPDGGDGGAPNIGDVDGDGNPEIGVASMTSYMLFNADGTIRWRSPISDHSSHSTGSTMFDFDRDGTMEIVYRDELSLRVYRGSDGVLLMKVPVGSSTWTEEPVVADVDNDGHADIIVSSDRSYDNTLNATGVYVFQDIANKWARTRRVWNQHSYHVTNINEDSSVPLTEQPAWLIPGLNQYRSNAFIPGETPSEDDSFTYKVTDGKLESNPATVRINIRPVNTPPHFTSSPVTAAATGLRYVYGPQAIDPDAGDVLTYSLPTAPTGMKIDVSFGLIQWTPDSTQTGAQNVTVKVQDSHGASALQMYIVTVGGPATVPDVTGKSQSDAEAVITGASLTLGTINNHNSPTVSAGIVLHQTPVAGSLAVAGSPVSIDVSLGPAPIGTVPNLVGAQQSNAQIDITASGFSVGSVNTQSSNSVPLGIVLIQNPIAGSIASVGSRISIVVSSGPPPGDVDRDGDGFTPNQGDCNDDDRAIHPGAFDIPGDGVDQDCNGVDAVPGDTTPPTAVIASPADDSTITMPVDIVGTVEDANLLRYKLEFGSSDSSQVTTLATGTTAINNAAIAKFDPTLLENGFYRVRLTVEDFNGQVTVDEKVYHVEGKAKVGVLVLSFKDLEIPLAGVPISIYRTYDSRVKTQHDFGIGWSLSLVTGTFQHNRPPGKGWGIFPGGIGLPCQTINEPVTHLTEVRLSEVEAYTFALTLTQPAGATGGCVAEAAYRFVDGRIPDAKLDILDGTQVFYANDDNQIVYLSTLLPFNPQKLRLTLVDGRIIDFDQSGMTHLSDINGNAITIGPNGITHSSGKSVAFTRDEQGRIAAITDPNGNTLNYGYDDNGDLVTFTNQVEDQTSFTYDSRHNLLDIIDAAGRHAMSNQYDTSGRLISVTDGAGNQASVVHNIDAHQDVITDRVGNVSVVEYDERGNITSQTDPLGSTNKISYDQRDNPLTLTNGAGATMVATYDASDSLTATADALQHLFHYSYNSRRQLTNMSDALGNATINDFDRSGNLVAVHDPLGNTRSYTYDDQGHRTSTTDALGNTTQYVYDNDGRLTQQIDPLGNSISYSYDANGNRLTESKLRSTPSGQQQLVTRYQYDGLNRLIATILPDGSSTHMEYNSIGQRSAVVNARGQRTTFDYDLVGRLSKTTYPDETSESNSYDAEGHRVASVDRAGRTTQYSYDAAGRLVETTYSDSATVTISYDAAGRVSRTTDERGNATNFSYDANGRKIQVRDALGNITSFTYDADGNKLTMKDARGKVTTYTYDAKSRPILTTFPDGSTQASTYDSSDHVNARTNQDGKTTAFAYDANGRLLSVKDALGQVTSYSYDEIGDLLTETDANGNSTRFGYDQMGRRVQRTLPLGQTESFTYDAQSNLTSRTDFMGNKTSYTYDIMNRLIGKTPDPRLHQAAINFTYTVSGQRASMTDASGASSYVYDTRDRLLSKVTSLGTLSYAYDAHGNVTSIKSSNTNGVSVGYTYDELNRLATVTDNRLSAGTTTYSYDAVGNLKNYTYPNGVSTAFTFDELSRLTNVNSTVNNSAVASFTYTLGPAGNRLSVADLGGRLVNYTNDSLYRLTAESITGDSIAQSDGLVGYTYDLVGNRLKRDSTIASLTPQSFTFDKDNHENGDLYDANGNSVAIDSSTFGFDFEDHLVSSGLGISMVYDGDGNRVEKTAGGVTTAYLVDDRNPTGLPQVVEELVAGNVQRAYTYGTSIISQRQLIAGNFTPGFYGHDGHGSVRYLTDASGAITDHYDYDAFGNLVRSDGTTPNVYLFSAEQFDFDLGAYYMRARYYQPDRGRFFSMDPFDGRLADPMSLHRYLYANADPVNLADPTGRDISLADLSVGLAIASSLDTIGLATVNGIVHASVASAFPDQGIVPGLAFSYDGPGGFALAKAEAAIIAFNIAGDAAAGDIDTFQKGTVEGFSVLGGVGNSGGVAVEVDYNAKENKAGTFVSFSAGLSGSKSSGPSFMAYEGVAFNVNTLNEYAGPSGTTFSLTLGQVAVNYFANRNTTTGDIYWGSTLGVTISESVGASFTTAYSIGPSATFTPSLGVWFAVAGALNYPPGAGSALAFKAIAFR